MRWHRLALFTLFWLTVASEFISTLDLDINESKVKNRRKKNTEKIEPKMQDSSKSFLIKDLLRDLIHTAETDTGTHWNYVLHFVSIEQKIAEKLSPLYRIEIVDWFVRNFTFECSTHPIAFYKSYQSHYVNEFCAISELNEKKNE